MIDLKNIKKSFGSLEVLKGIELAAASGTTYEMKSGCRIRPLKPGYYSTVWGSARADAERSLVE